MRIQHNIPAMNAYRNYNSNVKSLQANLQKLSSGYRINKAGDDAAGLAISEKMRAQITGLETAQKNAKDGISLVQTAEGALTEVHDMLNRMYELAEQSANGTYQDEVDREQMQKEIESLRSEINRIADGTNFNGIKLLDGSMSSKGTVGFGGKLTQFAIPPEGTQTLGTDTVLHKEAGTGSPVNKFSIELHNLTFANDQDAATPANKQKLELTIGTDKFTLEAGTAGTIGTALSASEIATAFTTAGSFKGANGTTAAVTAETDADGNTFQQIEIGGAKFKVSASGTTLNFEQLEDDTTTFDPAVEVSVKGLKAGESAAVTAGVAGTPANTTTVGTAGATEATINFDDLLAHNAAITTAVGNTPAITAGGTITIKADAVNNKMQLLVNGTVIGESATNPLGSATAGGSVDIAFTSTDASSTALGKIVVQASTGSTPTLGAFGASAITSGLVYNFAAGANAGTGDNPVSGDYNVSTTNIVKKSDATPERLASTVIQLQKDMIVDGSSITIGKSDYTFGKDVKIDDLDATSANYLTDVAARLTAAASGNTTYTVGHQDDHNGKITLTEKKGQTDYAENGKSTLTTRDAIAETLGYKSGGYEAKAGKALTLQIGDTSDDYNKMTVDVQDCHAAAMGIGDIDISHQEGASDAMDAIKNAINYVSDTRGDLGALQNRLDHTINNLSVAQENIQDAEATIRDVDVANEMMAYTKNNILVQAAQAMLAQANQLPQGVLQLLG